jgi:hypothetical protein
MWLTGRLAPDFKTIADFGRDNGPAVRNVCRRFVEICRELRLFSQALVAIDGSKFKAATSRDSNFTSQRVTVLLRSTMKAGCCLMHGIHGVWLARPCPAVLPCLKSAA